MRVRMSLATLLVLLAAPAVAQERFADNASYADLPAGGILEVIYGCPRGYHLLSGGYSMTQSDQSGQRLSVLQSQPHSLTHWSVRVQNVTPYPIGGQLQITVLCEAN